MNLKKSLKHLKYRLLWHLLPRLRIVSKYPIHLDIESTNACNLKCIMCCRDFMEDGVGQMSQEIYAKIFQEVIPYSIKLNWRGEPFLHPQIVWKVAYAKN